MKKTKFIITVCTNAYCGCPGIQVSMKEDDGKALSIDLNPQELRKIAAHMIAAADEVNKCLKPTSVAH